MGENRIAYVILVGRPEGKTPPERPIRRWEGNIKMDFECLKWENVNWIPVAQDGTDKWCAVVNTFINIWAHKYARNLLTS